MANAIASLSRSFLRRCRRQASKILDEPVIADVYAKAGIKPLEGKDVAVFIAGRVVEAILPIPEAFDRLAGMILEYVADATLDAISKMGKKTSLVNLHQRFKDQEDLYLAVTPTRFVIFRFNPFMFSFKLAEALLIVPRSLLVGCSFGGKYLIISYPYDLQLVVLFSEGIAVEFGVPRQLAPEAEKLQQVIQEGVLGQSG